jgi:hypothetical protein
MVFFSVWVLVLLLLSEPLPTNAQAPRKGTSAPKSQQAVPTVRFDSGNSALKIPLEIDNNLILIRVRVNGSKPLKFLFDTGASHSIIDSRRFAELGLKAQGQASGSATGGPIQGSYATGVSLKVPGAEVSDQLLASIIFPTVPGFEMDGIIGYDFINQFVIEIDYLKKIMNLYNPRTYAYRGTGKAMSLLFDERRTPFMVTKIILEGRAPVEARLGVDTGADGTFLFNSPFVEKQRLLAAMTRAIQDRGSGAGGEQKRLLGKVNAVQLGQFVLKDPPVALSLDTEGAGATDKEDGVVGGDILRRFKMIIDYSRKRMILEPNKSFKDPYNVETGGD